MYEGHVSVIKGTGVITSRTSSIALAILFKEQVNAMDEVQKCLGRLSNEPNFLKVVSLWNALLQRAVEGCLWILELPHYKKDEITIWNVQTRFTRTLPEARAMVISTIWIARGMLSRTSEGER